MEPPSRLFRRPPVLAVLYVSVIISRTLLRQRYRHSKIVCGFVIILSVGVNKNVETFSCELDSMERMLMQTELTVMAGDHESYRISAKRKERVFYISYV